MVLYMNTSIGLHVDTTGAQTWGVVKMVAKDGGIVNTRSEHNVFDVYLIWGALKRRREV